MCAHVCSGMYAYYYFRLHICADGGQIVFVQKQSELWRDLCRGIFINGFNELCKISDWIWTSLSTEQSSVGLNRVDGASMPQHDMMPCRFIFLKYSFNSRLIIQIMGICFNHLKFIACGKKQINIRCVWFGCCDVFASCLLFLLHWNSHSNVP